MNTIDVVRINSRGVETTHTLPAVFDVCDRCEGHGTHLHPDIGSHAYSAEEFAESFDDEERGEYFRHGGRYDVTCGTCHGKRVVLVADTATLETSTRGRRQLALYEAVMDGRAADAAERAAERRYGY